ncbi:hypothetical protein [Bosea rubneri]|uniref:DnaD N-terminal domain-containing protein n=1 Tax=Bosea rubneri TaxID=3075434 RepID=A0ABU3SEC8_9HYPH|nr:hypothetical protein [Bosea sp. ZW T0_25]MDU0343148.1 hypothetical protein [Bosea sp. ZW T0_25]
MAKPASKAEVETLRKNEAKWTKTVLAAGWNAFPSIIIEKQEALGLDAIDINIILHLSNYWWVKENLPHPSVGAVAKALRISERTVQKRITALCKTGFMERTERRNTRVGSTTNLYSFNGLIEKVSPFAKEKLQQVEKHQEEKAERLARKRPKLVVDNE